jgi:release factor glutamine methyltransferase
MNEPWIILKLLKWGEEWLTKKNVSFPRFAMECLVGQVLKKKRLELYLAFEELVPDEVLQELKPLLNRAASGEPLQYILGEAEFYQCTLLVDKNVLIPRPETEAMMEEVCGTMQKRLQAGLCETLRAVDLGSGSGCLSIALAKQYPNTQITAVDISEKALLLAQENAKKNQVSEQIQFVCEDMLMFLDKNAPWDLILCNPPYVSKEEFETLSPTVRLFEPRSALTDEGDGTFFIAQVLTRLPEKLAPRGSAFIEFADSMSDWVLQKTAAFPEFHSELFRDFAGRWRFVKVTNPQLR